MTEEHLASCLKRLDDAQKLLDTIRVDLRGAQEFRDAVYDLLEGTPFGAQADSTYDGLYGRLQAAIKAAVPPPQGAEWYTRAVKARNNLNDAIKELRGGYSTKQDRCDVALAELDIVLGLAPYRTGSAAPPAAVQVEKEQK